MQPLKAPDSVRRILTRRRLLCASALLPLGLGSRQRAAGQGRNGAERLVNVEGEKVSFYSGDRLLFEYRYSAARPKTYVHPFCAPDGTVFTIDGPPDHVHHRGVMLAWSGVNGFDLWGETNPAPHGQIVHQRFEQIRKKAPVAVTAIEHWIAEGKVMVIERRTIRVPKVSPQAVWMEWESELRPAGERVLLSAKGHPYDGLGIRFVHSMDQGGVLNSKGTREIQKANGEEANWCCYFGPLGEGRDGGVAIFDHPSNPRHPTAFFVMNKPFGYLSAAPTFREPFQLETGGSLRLRYAVVGLLGKPQQKQLDDMYGEWSA